MDRESAVRLAAEIVEKMGNNPELNSRGYKVDGWKPFTGPERADAIVKIAQTLIDPEPPSPVAPPPPGVTLLAPPPFPSIDEHGQR